MFLKKKFPFYVQLAFLNHFQTCEFSYLIVKTDQEMAVEIDGLSKPARQRLLQLLNLPTRSTAAVSTLQEGLASAYDWKLALKSVREVAVGTGYKAGTESYFQSSGKK